MSLATGILSQDCVADDAASVETFITAEVEALQAELFATNFGMDWRMAWDWAISMLPDVLCYAAEWDADVAAQRAVQNGGRS